MTDKQIIDVTQCPYYKEDKTCTYLPFESKCEGDCNWTAYKEMEEQLKHKEQECEELKEQLELNTANAVVIDMAQRLYKLKQTLIEIKEICNSVWGNGLDEEVDKFGLILQKISEVEDE
jgi:hypothetical protein